MSTIYGGPFTHISSSGSVEYDAGEPCDGIVNLTPHPIVVAGLPGPYTAEGRAAEARSGRVCSLRIPSHGSVRLVEGDRSGKGAARHHLVSWMPDCLGMEPIAQVEMGSVVGDLPVAISGGYFAPVTQEPGMMRRERGPRIWFVVSLLAAMALRGTRDDLLTTGPEIRDESGRILGCLGLRRVV